MIYLVGMMGSGKSTVAGHLAKKLGWTAVDLDDAIEKEAGLSIPALFESEGEEGFRRWESAALSGLTGPRLVVATGGGAVLRKENRTLMRERGTVIYLQASRATLKERLKSETAHRPLLAGGLSVIDGLLEKRQALYEEAAHHRVSVDGKTPAAVVEAVLTSLAGTLVV